MIDEVRLEAVDMVVTAVEKHPGNYEVPVFFLSFPPPQPHSKNIYHKAAAKTIKELMDKRCGSSWHAIVGEGYGFEVTHEMRNLLYMYFGGNLVCRLLVHFLGCAY